jgi:hypothetical protein
MRAPRSVALDGELREAFLAERDRMLAAMDVKGPPASEMAAR